MHRPTIGTRYYLLMDPDGYCPHVVTVEVIATQEVAWHGEDEPPETRAAAGYTLVESAYTAYPLLTSADFLEAQDVDELYVYTPPEAPL